MERQGLNLKSNSISNTNNDFLKQYYSANISYGKSVVTLDENGQELSVSEVIVDSDLHPRGYIVNRTSDNKLLYFADFDTKNNKMTSMDLTTGETDVMDGLNDNEYYLESGGDIISIIEEANSTTTFGLFVWFKWIFTMDNFWGSTIEETGPCTDELQPNGTVISSQPVLTSKRVFWIRWSSPTPGRRLC